MIAPAMRGMLLMALAMQIVPVSDALAKFISGTHGYAAAQTAWARCAFGALFLALFVARGSGVPGPRRWWSALRPHWLRGACWAGATMFYFIAISQNPLPSSLALLFVAPLFVACSAPFFLGERFSPRLLAAACVGFFGVLIIVRPSADGFSPSLLWALMSGLCYGGYLMATRGARMRPAQTAFMAMVTGGILLLPAAAWTWRAPDMDAWLLMAAMGCVSALGHFLIAKACEKADASQIAPFVYTEMASATALSYFWFRELPDLFAACGIALVIAAGVYAAMSGVSQARGGAPVERE